MNQNYNSLLSPNKPTPPIHFTPLNDVHKSGPTSKQPLKQWEKRVSLSGEEVMREIEVFSWRNKTSFPVLKVTDYSVYPSVHPPTPNPIIKVDPSNIYSPNKSKEDAAITDKMRYYISTHSEVSRYELWVKTEEIKMTLEDIQMLPVPQIIHLLKEVFIGFEALVGIFGLFTPKQKMIVLNERQQWKVWINEQYVLSNKSTPYVSETEFILDIIGLVELHSPPNSHSKNLFSFLKSN